MSRRLMAKVTVKDVIRKGISTSGNPSYWVDFRTNDSLLSGINASIGYTASNAPCGYTASNFVGKECVIEYHFTSKGSLIIDTMKGGVVGTIINNEKAIGILTGIQKYCKGKTWCLSCPLGRDECDELFGEREIPSGWEINLKAPKK